MTNRRLLRPISETKNTLDFNRTYILAYVWEDDYFDRDKPTAVFTGKEIFEALCSISEPSDKEPQEYNEHLHQLIKISGRVETNRKLSSAHCPELISHAKRVNMGCEDAREELRRDMAIYIAFHLDEVAESDASMASEDFSAEDFAENTPAVLFVHDYDDGDDDYLSDDRVFKMAVTQPASNIVQFPSP